MQNDDNVNIEVAMYNDGARPDKKDIFVEVDWMPGHKIETKAKFLVEKEFALHDIDLHIDDGGLWGGTRLIYDDDISLVERNNYIKGVGGPNGNEGFTQSRRGIFYYWIFAHDSTDVGVPGHLLTYAGQEAAGAGVDEFTIVLLCNKISADNQKWFIMHEFGHNLLHEIDNPSYRSAYTGLYGT
ncbi:MAG: hypothetical protein AB1779_06880 [Candidatus Thermoplasmatota archaeon]